MTGDEAAGMAEPPGTAPGQGPGSTRIDAGALLRRAAAGGAARAGPHLVVREPQLGERVVALSGACTVGRGRAAALRLVDPSASRLHLRLQLDDEGATVEDLGSRNGLLVNGRRARGQRRLRSGDQLVVGETSLRYLDPLEAACATGPRPTSPGRPPEPAVLLAGAALLFALAAAALWVDQIT